MSGKRLLLAMLLLASCAMAQTQIGNPYDHGPTLPASCAPTNSSGAVFFKTAATIGLYQCLTPNTWTTVGGAVFASGGTTLNQVPKSNGAGQLVDSVGLSEAYPNFTVNEQLIFNGSVTGLGGMTWGQLAAPTGAAAVQLAATGGFLLHNQAYFYKITATSLVGESTVSNEATFTTGALPAPDTYSATVTWNAVTGATGYNVYRSTVSGSELLLATVTPGNTNSYTDNTNGTPSGAMPTTNTSAGITVSGPVTATAFNASNSNGGFSAVEGTGAGLTAGAGTDLMWADSTAHCFKANYNNTAVGCVATLGVLQTFTSTLAAAAGTTNASNTGVPSYQAGASKTGIAADGANLVLMTSGYTTADISDSGTGGYVRFNNYQPIGWSSGSSNNTAIDTMFTRRASANVNLGAVDLNGTPVNQKITTQGAVTGTNLPGGNLEIAPGPGTGNGVGAQLALDRYLMLGTGATQQSTQHAIVACESKTLSNTSATAQTVIVVNLASNSAGGAFGTFTVTATDATNFDSETQSFNVSYVNKGGALTIGTPAITASTAASNSGSTTIGITAVAGTNQILLKVTPVFTTIVPTTVTWYGELNNHGTGSVVCQ